jgi:hypothetical protein
MHYFSELKDGTHYGFMMVHKSTIKSKNINIMNILVGEGVVWVNQHVVK